jgi:cell division protein FtsB
VKRPWARGGAADRTDPLARLRSLDEPLSKTEAAKARRAEQRRRRRRRLIALNAGGLAVLSVFAFVAYVFPTRTLLAHRDAVNQRERELSALQADNARLAERIAQLQDPEEIERIAREDYGYVRPGEQAFVVLPGPPPELPATWPYPMLAKLLEHQPG